MKKALALVFLIVSMTFTACAGTSGTTVKDDISGDNSSQGDISSDNTPEDNTVKTDTPDENVTKDDVSKTDPPDAEGNQHEPFEYENTPFGKHGRLSVSGTDLVDENGEKYQLYGMSTHGLAWFPQYVNYDAFKTLRDGWNTNCVRLALYTYEYGGYCNGGDQENLKNLIKAGVEYADELGMYVIIDWHVLNDHDPNVYKDEAIRFFDEITDLYKDHDNIIYEICNEPNTSADWNAVKSYAQAVIPVIRSNDSDAVILVGSPTWSQDIDKALADPLEYDNLMYTLHFYADTHKDWLRERAENCIESGLPVFISEFNICDASGKGYVNVEEGDKWYELIEKYNLSYMCWSLANGSDSCNILSDGNPKTSGWTESDLSDSGKWLFEKFMAESD